LVELGRNLIKKCIGFDMKVKVFDPFVVSADIEKYGGEKVENFEDAINQQISFRYICH
jgi:D-3-phosphoglycerate dehydrogenase